MDALYSFIEFLSFDPARLLSPDMLVRFAIQVALLCGSAFFSSSETDRKNQPRFRLEVR